MSAVEAKNQEEDDEEESRTHVAPPPTMPRLLCIYQKNLIIQVKPTTHNKRALSCCLINDQF